MPQVGQKDSQVQGCKGAACEMLSLNQFTYCRQLLWDLEGSAAPLCPTEWGAVETAKAKPNLQKKPGIPWA